MTSSYDNWQTRSLPPLETRDRDMMPVVPLRKVRSFGVPGLRQPFKSNLRVKTQRESLQCSWGCSNQEPKTLLWREVNIRQYERTVGDNPSCSSGPPLSIGWNYNLQSDFMSVDGYEKQRSSRRSHMDLLLSREEREYLLLDEWEVPRTEVTAAVRSTIKVKNQRRTTVTNLSKATKLEEVMESAGRKWKRALSFQKRPSVEAAAMIEQHLAAQAQRYEILTNLSGRSDQTPTTTTAQEQQARPSSPIQSPTDAPIESPPTTINVSYKAGRSPNTSEKLEHKSQPEEPNVALSHDVLEDFDVLAVPNDENNMADEEEEHFLSYAEEQMAKQRQKASKSMNPIRDGNGTAQHGGGELHSGHDDWGFDYDDGNELQPERAATVPFSSDTRAKKLKKPKKGKTSTSKKKKGDGFE